MPLLETTLAAIEPIHAPSVAEARRRLDSLTKPPGSLGRLEDLAAQLVGITRNPRPALPRKVVLTLAGDHGICAEGVSAYPSAVTPQMVYNFVRGGAAVNALARAAGARVVVVDVGVAADLSALARDGKIVDRKVRLGTANFARERAMSREEAMRAVEAGITAAREVIDAGCDLIGVGDMGIGNTTASSAIVAALTGVAPAEVTGRGTGIGDAAWENKVRVIERALALHRPDPRDPLDVLSKVGGLEIGAIAGAILAGAARRVPVVLDGFIAGAGGLLAAGLKPEVRGLCIAAHVSCEKGHRIALERLGLLPLLDLGLRLGEGTGAALAFHLVEAALRMLNEMATFGEAGVSGPA